MRDFRRQLDSAQSFSANAPISFDLPRDSVYKEIALLLEVQVTTIAGGAFSGFFDGSPWTLLKRIELIADGKDTIKSYDGGTLVDINMFDFGTYPPTALMTLGASATTGLLRFIAIISLEAKGMLMPQHTWLDARKLSSLELRVTFGAGIADLAATTTNATLDTYRITPFGHEILDVAGESTFSIAQEVMTSQAFPTNTGTQRKFRLNVGNAYSRILISTRDSNARAGVNRLLRIALIENGIFTRRNWDAGLLKLHNSLVYAPSNFNLGSAPNIPGSSTTGRAGGFRDNIYSLNIAEDGAENSLLDTRGYSDLSLELDWDGPNTTDLIRFTPRIYVPAAR